jgi:RNA polymerase sigma factor (sigma-70 family)
MGDDDDIWRRLLAGDRDVFSEHAETIFMPVRRFFINKTDDVRELTQRTFARVEERRHTYAATGSARSFVLGIGRMILFEYWREQARVPEVDFEELSVAQLNPSPSSVLAARADARMLLEGLRTLTLPHQIVVELHYWEGMSDREIAEVLHENENTVRGRRTRARQRLGEIMDMLAKREALPPTSMDFERWAKDVGQQLGRPHSD